MPNDPKWRTISRISKQPVATVQAVFIHLLVSASRNVTRGHVDVTEEDLASSLDVTEEEVRSILDAMEGRVIEKGCITGWDKRQVVKEDSGNSLGTAKTPAERKAAQRERERQAMLQPQNSGESHNVTVMSRRVTTDTDTDTDKELQDPPFNPPGEKSGKKGFDPLAVNLPAWLSPELWREWVEYRRQLKKPIKTQQGVTGMLKKLEEFRGKGHEPEAVIRETMANEWQGLFEPKNSQVTYARNQSGSGSMAERSLQQGREQWLREQSDRHASMASVGEHGADLRQPLDCEEWQSSYAPVGAANRYDDR
jgi:hypothetical protein